MSKLIIIRGNSGSGKTTLSKELQHKFGRNTMVISQDVIRREMLWVKDEIGNVAVSLMINLLTYGKAHSDVVILEGIFYSEIYRPLFEAAINLYGDDIWAYFYELPFEETLARHETREKRVEFGEEAMREWWRERDFIEIIPERSLTKELSLEEAVHMIVTEVMT